MGFEPMDQDIIRQLIEQEEDYLSEAIREEERLYRHCSCPNCSEQGAEKRPIPPEVVIGEDGSPVLKTSPFSPDHPLPKGYAHCKNCGADFNPLTGVIRSAPNVMIHDPHEDLLQE